MDKLAVTGVIIAIVAIVGGYAVEGGALSALFHLPAFLIVFGGTFGAVMLQTPHRIFVDGLAMFKQIWSSNTPDFEHYQAKICKWSEVARQQGFLALEKHIHVEPDPFVKKALTMLVDGVDSEVVRGSLQLEIELEMERKYKSANIYEAFGGYSPTIGIIGAVLGLIQAMANIDDPNALGMGIATAFVATIYGVGSANLLFIPFGQKLKAQIDQEVLFKEMVVHGTLAAGAGENPQNIAKRLNAFTLYGK